jgi:hypothetical protein
MWSAVLGLGLLTALNPLRLGLALLVISRPRPLQNLFAYWVGCLTGCTPAVVVPLTLLHVTPMFTSFGQHLAASPSVRHIRFGMGVAALSIAALMIVHSLARRRPRAQLPNPSGTKATAVLESNKPSPFLRLLGRVQNAPTEEASAFRRLLGRVHNAWENGSLWLAFVIGLVFGGVDPDTGVLLLAIIVTSGAAIGTQITAAIVFVAVTLVIVEITLASYLVTPVKTQKTLRLLHDWALTHRRKILVGMCALVGLGLVVANMGSL